jgi:hypothetical protein
MVFQILMEVIMIRPLINVFAIFITVGTSIWKDVYWTVIVLITPMAQFSQTININVNAKLVGNGILNNLIVQLLIVQLFKIQTG